MEFDEIIVGAGSAGAVLAARLTEDSHRRVLLLEAGPDYQDISATPAALLDGRRLPGDHDWGYTAEMVPGRVHEYPRGKVTGGSSAVNACLALRGLPADYDEWAALGNPDWAWSQVLPVFRSLENDQDAQGKIHGTDGPTSVRRYSREELWPAQRAFLGACRAVGIPETDDHNHPESTGVGLGPWNFREDGTRVSTAIAYLLPARRRPNLVIRSNCLVDRIIVDGSRVTGLELEQDGVREKVFGKRITLSGGTIGSPAILLRSGIGPPDDLTRLGIEPRVPLPGVGANLIEHAGIGVSWVAGPGMVTAETPLVQTVLRFTAPGSSLTNDMQILQFQTMQQPSLRLRTFLMKPHSRGFLRLSERDPHVQPEIRLNLASDPEDVRRLAEGLRLVSALIRTPAMAAHVAPNISFDDGTSMSIEDAHRMLTQEDQLHAYIQRSVRHYVHPVGTARMGATDDPLAVVDQHCRVRGLTNLRVVDASIMPTIPSANTHLPSIMIGERAAAWMRQESD